MKSIQLMILALVLALAMGCKKDIQPGNDPNFTITSHSDKGMKSLEKKVEVFGIPIYANKSVDDKRLLHAANVMAQYLDNDEDGNVDNQAVVDQLINNNARLMMWKRKRDLIKPGLRGNIDSGQDLGNNETRPEWHANGKSGQFDAALEEVWHLISHVGYTNAYPNAFGESAGSTLCNAMDIARGGRFTEIPSSYPSEAWYTYDDKTCGYECMATEYFYWALTSMMGAQENRLDEIGQEWDLVTRELVEQRDPAVFELLTDPQYKLPTVMPDGTYRH